MTNQRKSEAAESLQPWKPRGFYSDRLPLAHYAQHVRNYHDRYYHREAIWMRWTVAWNRSIATSKLWKIMAAGHERGELGTSIRICSRLWFMRSLVERKDAGLDASGKRIPCDLVSGNLGLWRLWFTRFWLVRSVAEWCRIISVLD